ncbi:hypothetical protein [Haloarcula sp. 1CSR25-25]|uniref:hypothetical protein n=1 Tax=Haloarcula sp. 1CSR25-25 TaxID=2862545 RepID=UPI002895278B|nr:hypothetical protein [Haloarcula sp. 1CSR25-25]MDT3434692.1 hypothetical protein [Haloarcula sp. 1CSR25-25]
MGESVEPHVVKLRDDAAGWRRVDGPHLTPEEPFLTGLSEQTADALVGSQWALEHSDVEAAKAHRYGSTVEPFAPSEMSVDALRDRLADGDYTADELDALETAETAGKDRTTALDAIHAAREDD